MTKSRPPKPTAPPAMKTRTLPEEQRGAWFDGPDVVTMLRVYGTPLAFELPRDVKKFTIGSSPEQDIAIPTEFLSRLHCLLERRGPSLRVYDQQSKNGTFFNDRRESAFDLRPGETFVAGSIRFLALNDEMREAYPTLVELLGPEEEHTLHVSSTDQASPSALLVAATHNENILITGEPGCDQTRLARTIHQMSLLRSRSVVEVERIPDDRAEQRDMIDRATRSTLVMSIEPRAPVMDAAFCSMIFSPSYHIRLIALAPSVSKANDVLGSSYVLDMRHIPLQPLARRRRMIPRLLDRMLADRGVPLRVSDMTRANQAALQAHDWPGNFDDLRTCAERIATLGREQSLRKTAEALGLNPSTLHYWFTNTVGLSLPLVPDRPEA